MIPGGKNSAQSVTISSFPCPYSALLFVSDDFPCVQRTYILRKPDELPFCSISNKIGKRGLQQVPSI